MRCVVIGGDAAGMSAASQIRRAQPDWDLVVLEKGDFTSYAACGIPYLIAGDIPTLDDLVVVSPEEFRAKRNIDVRTGWTAVSIDPQAHKINVSTSAGDKELDYDRLLIATGAEPIIPRWPGVSLDGVVSLRTLTDASQILEQLGQRPMTNVVIIGGGYVGLEMAEAFGRRGLPVTVVEKQAAVMGGTEERVNTMVSQELSDHDVDLRLSTTVQGFEGENGRLCRVVTDAGILDADLALISLGVRPRTALAAKAGIELGAGNAIRVNERQETNVKNIWAAGDCAEAYHRVLNKPVYVPLALGANRQGRVAGINMAGGDDRFPGILGSAVTRIFDLAIGRTGVDQNVAGAEGVAVATVEAKAPSRAHYMPGHGAVWVKIIYRTDDLRVIGGWLCGYDACLGKRTDIIATAIAARMTILELSDLDLSYAPPFAPVWDPVIQAANKARFTLGSS